MVPASMILPACITVMRSQTAAAPPVDRPLVSIVRWRVPRRFANTQAGASPAWIAAPIFAAVMKDPAHGACFDSKGKDAPTKPSGRHLKSTVRSD